MTITVKLPIGVVWQFNPDRTLVVANGPSGSYKKYTWRLESGELRYSRHNLVWTPVPEAVQLAWEHALARSIVEAPAVNF